MRGCVYKLHNNDESVIYIGSTIQTLQQRWWQHKSAALTEDTTIYRHIRDHGGINSFQMTALLIVEVNTRSALRQLEQQHIEQYNCCNEIAAYVSPDFDWISKMKEKLTCSVCDTSISYRNMARHKRLIHNSHF